MLHRDVETHDRRQQMLRQKPIVPQQQLLNRTINQPIRAYNNDKYRINYEESSRNFHFFDCSHRAHEEALRNITASMVSVPFWSILARGRSGTELLLTAPPRVCLVDMGSSCRRDSTAYKQTDEQSSDCGMKLQNIVSKYTNTPAVS